MADIRVMVFAHEIDLSTIILEGDSEVVVEALRSDDEPLASFGHLIVYAESYADTFSSISFSHTCG